MSEFATMENTELTAEEKKGVELFCTEARDALGSNLKSITLYGSAVRGDYLPGRSNVNLMMVAAQYDQSALRALLSPFSRGLRNRIHALLVTMDELKSSSYIFPVKFLTIKESYIVLLGADYLADMTIASEHLRLRCEQEIMNLLLRIRRHYVYNGSWGVAEKISTSIAGFLDNLRVFMSLDGNKIHSRQEAVVMADQYGIPSEVLREALAVKEGHVPLGEIETIFEKYLLAVEKAAKIVGRRKD